MTSGTELRRDPPDSSERQNPYVGLRPFRTDEAELFFGRDDQVYELLNRLRVHRFLLVIGPSGCGKSSLIRAGLIAPLLDGFAVEQPGQWRIVEAQPRNAPLDELSRALIAGLWGSDAADPEQLAMMRATIRSGVLGLVEAVREAHLEPGEKVLVLVDQFEELFHFITREERLGQGEAAAAQASQYIKLLLEVAAARDVPVYVVLTMRSEYLGACGSFEGLAEAINDSLYLVPRMGRDQLREAIECPAIEFGGHVDDRLVNRMLNDVAAFRDQLPLLQHALMRMWEPRPADRSPGLDLDDYKAVHGVAEALSRHAEDTYTEELTPGQQKIAEALLRSITDVNPQASGGDRKVRRPDTLGRISARTGVPIPDLVAVIDVFRGRGRSFLTPEGPLTETSLIDLSHESLIRSWPRLSAWVDEEAALSAALREIAGDATKWEARDRDDSFLYVGLQLAEAEQTLDRSRSRLTPLELEFLARSRALENRRDALAHLRTRAEEWKHGGRSYLLTPSEIAKARQLIAEDELSCAKSGQLERELVQASELSLNQGTRNRQLLAAGVSSALVVLGVFAVVASFRSEHERLRADQAVKQATALNVARDIIEDAARAAVAGLPAQQQQESERALARMERFQPDRARGKYLILYFRKDGETVVEDYLVPRWRYYGFTADLRNPKYPRPTNSIWAGKSVPLSEIRLLACTLIRAGISVHHIARAPAGSSYGPNVIQVGSRIGVETKPPWTVERLWQATDFPVENGQ